MEIIDDRIRFDDARNLAEYVMDHTYTEHECIRCGSRLKIPLRVSHRDKEEFNGWLDIIKKFLKKHPEVEASMMEELCNDILDALGAPPEEGF